MHRRSVVVGKLRGGGGEIKRWRTIRHSIYGEHAGRGGGGGAVRPNLYLQRGRVTFHALAWKGERGEKRNEKTERSEGPPVHA